MDRTYQHIFTPLTIRGITLKNRIEIAPISVFDLDTTPERHPSERDMQFFRMRAMGGAAMVTLGDCIVDPSGEDSGKLASPKDPGGARGQPALPDPHRRRDPPLRRRCQH